MHAFLIFSYCRVDCEWILQVLQCCLEKIHLSEIFLQVLPIGALGFSSTVGAWDSWTFEAKVFLGCYSGNLHYSKSFWILFFCPFQTVSYFFKDYPIDSVCCLNMDFTTQCWLRRQTFGYWMPASTRAVGCAPNARRKGWNRGRNFQGLDRFETVQNSILNSSVEFNESQGFYWKCMWPTGDSSVLCRWRPMISSKPSMESLG